MRRKTAFVLALALALTVLACGAASATVYVGRLAIEDQPLHSTMHIVEGSIPKFADAGDADLVEQLSGIVERFYNKVMLSARPKDGGPYPPVRFAYDVFDSGRTLSLLLHGSVSAGAEGSHLVRTIVLDRKTYRVLSLQDILGADGNAAAERFIRGEMLWEPSRYLPGVKPPKVGDETSFYLTGMGDLVFIFDKDEIAPASAGTPQMIYPAEDLPWRRSDRARISLAAGKILDATMNTITIQADDGRKLSFSTMDADKSQSRGLLIGSRVEIYYTGEIKGTDTSKVTVVRVRQPKER